MPEVKLFARYISLTFEKDSSKRIRVAEGENARRILSSNLKKMKYLDYIFKWDVRNPHVA